jgi:signal-transduction protein with cAMP-binding, CBS, and nucleotidyltransferase domain
MHDIVDFLQRHPPFDSLDQEELERVAAAVEIEFHAADAHLGEQRNPSSPTWFGAARSGCSSTAGCSICSGRERCSASPRCSRRGRWAFVARAAEDTLLYLIREHVIRPVLERPAALSFVARSLSRAIRPPGRPHARAGRVAERAPGRRADARHSLALPPATTVRSAAEQMAEAGVTCVVVDLDDECAVSAAGSDSAGS